MDSIRQHGIVRAGFISFSAKVNRKWVVTTSQAVVLAAALRCSHPENGWLLQGSSDTLVEICRCSHPENGRLLKEYVHLRAIRLRCSHSGNEWLLKEEHCTFNVSHIFKPPREGWLFSATYLSYLLCLEVLIKKLFIRR